MKHIKKINELFGFGNNLKDIRKELHKLTVTKSDYNEYEFIYNNDKYNVSKETSHGIGPYDDDYFLMKMMNS